LSPNSKNPLSVARTQALGFGLLLVLMAVAMALALYAIGRGQSALQTVYEDRAVPLQQLGRIHYLVARNRIVLDDAADRGTPDVIDKRVSEYEKNAAEVRKHWQAYLATQLTEDEKRLIAAVDAAYKTLDGDGFSSVASALRAGNVEGGRAAMKGKVSPQNPAFVEAMEALIGLQVKVAAAEYGTSSAVGARLKMALVALSVASLLLALLAAVWITRSLVRRLGAEPAALAAVAERIAGGDLGAQGLPKAPAGSVMAAMLSMRASLASVVGTVRAGVDQVATASAQIAQGNGDLSSRTEEQAASLQQTASSMEQLTGSVRSSAENARQANQLAQGASAVARRGGEVVGQVVATMGEIEQASRKISEIIGVIDGIAFQTNILALNAAVEAARAGEQGRGFAVVAGEVRTLAQRSSEAARQIRGLIGDSVQRVESGSTLVRDAGETMEQIVSQVQRVGQLINEITAAVGEQTEGIEQVGVAVQQIDRTTQQNAALVEESAAAAASLRSQAERLAAAVAAFRVDAAVAAR
jgi:methyl-accepting chemotaxis protein-1 (serine sensor receptor)